MSFSALHSTTATSPSPTRSPDTPARARASTSSSRTFSRRSSASREDHDNGGGGTTTAAAAARRTAGVGLGVEGHKATPPGSPQPDTGNGPVAKRVTPGRGQPESVLSSSTVSTALAAANRKVMAAADRNFVPPISVLIVDGMFLFILLFFFLIQLMQY